PLNFIALIDQSLFMQGFEGPPNRLDIVIVESNIRVIQINPVSHAGGKFIPQILVFEDALAALVIIFSYAIVFYLRSALQAQLFLYFNLDGKAMRIPASFAFYPIAF